MAPNPTVLALVAFKGPIEAPSPRNEINNNGAEKGKDLAMAIYHEVQKKAKTSFLPQRKNYPRFTRLTEVEQVAVRLYLNTRVDG